MSIRIQKPKPVRPPARPEQDLRTPSGKPMKF